MRRTFLVETMILATFAVGMGTASAQPTETTSANVAADADKAAKANELFRAGMSDVKQQNWAAAEAKFIAALALNPSYDIASNLGQTQYRLKRYRDAAENLEAALRVWPVIGKQDHREAATKRLAEVRTLVASLTIRVSAQGAAVLIDGKQVGRSPLQSELFVEPGTHVIEAKLAGFEDAKQTLEAAKGSSQEVALTLKAAAKVPSSPVAGAVDRGSQTEQTDGQVEPIVKPKSRVPIFVGIGVATAALGVGIGGAVASANNSDHAEEIRTPLAAIEGAGACKRPANAGPCKELSEAVDASKAYRTMSIVGFTVAGAAALATVAYWVWPQSAKKERPVTTAVVLSPAGGGAMVFGSF